MRVKAPETKLKAPGAASPQRPKAITMKQSPSQESANSGAGASAILSQAFEEKGIMEQGKPMKLDGVLDNGIYIM